MENIDRDFEDIIKEKPYDFKVGRKCFKLYPATLAKTLDTKDAIARMGVDAGLMRANPYLEALRLATGQREECCRILALHTAPNTYKDYIDTRATATRMNVFAEGLSDENLAALLIVVLTADKTDEVMRRYGMDKERERMHRVMTAKGGARENSVTFGGLTIMGTFIGRLKEMGYTDNEIRYERGYSYLRLMLADKMDTVYLTDEERQRLYDTDGGSVMDANDPKSAEKIKECLAQRGITINQQ